MSQFQGIDGLVVSQFWLASPLFADNETKSVVFSLFPFEATMLRILAVHDIFLFTDVLVQLLEIAQVPDQHVSHVSIQKRLCIVPASLNAQNKHSAIHLASLLFIFECFLGTRSMNSSQ